MRFAGMPMGVPAEAHIVVWVGTSLERGSEMRGAMRLAGMC